jgi:hypothetical protein|tara:strand:+ start:622 stop:822 length:201 start_codon:yes stop_codon:yes gene_type:complete
MYYEGWGVTKDYAEAVKWYRKAYFFNPWCRLKRTELGVDAAFPGKMTQRKKIMVGMKTGLTVGLRC